MLNTKLVTERIAKIINDNNLSASSFAKLIGVQRSSISHILSGRNNPSLDLLLKIHKSFDYVSLEWLILGDNSLKNPPSKLENMDSNKKSTLETDFNHNNESLLREIVYYYNDGSFERFFPKA
jgi:Plasmid maintenance system antidote protein|tara:strand:+ start:1761 stop:2129 length:369 start_codon:yes stop_codon:yes gene_type:complete